MATRLTPAEIALLGMETVLAYRAFWKENDEFEELKKQEKGVMTPKLLMKLQQASKAREEYIRLFNEFVNEARHIPNPEI